ncbi:hypothetical protein [Azospirillum picis]|uniref:Uncharacterized protein n=1 Tax=Azospirillum picis TaxID=488438 RepID=A0ABU0MSH8_9PROT|nr:hypothetical protein [Azospirillum picis]MBP2301994.1 hypothetical protein [Azospirillum picis]MDQ0536443.1 hypothetical protein [Azospirillum picis]
MIGNDGRPVSKDELRRHVAVYNGQPRGSKDFAMIPRALVTVLDGLKPGKTGYVKCLDGQVQLSRRKDNSVSAG